MPDFISFKSCLFCLACFRHCGNQCIVEQMTFYLKDLCSLQNRYIDKIDIIVLPQVRPERSAAGEAEGQQPRCRRHGHGGDHASVTDGAHTARHRVGPVSEE